MSKRRNFGGLGEFAPLEKKFLKLIGGNGGGGGDENDPPPPPPPGDDPPITSG